VSRAHRALDGAAAAARATLSPDDAARFDRLAKAVLGSPGGVLGPALRAALPGTAGIRWLAGAGLSPGTRAAALTAEQWRSLFACWAETAEAPRSGAAANGRGGRPSAHGHAPGAKAVPRWF
jgi:hypothetical protein